MKPLSDHLEEFLAHSASLNQSRHTTRMLRHCLRQTLRWLESLHAVTMPVQLTAARIEAWVRHVSQRRNKSSGLPLKPASIAKQFEADRSFLRWLEKRGVAAAGLHDGIPAIKQPELLPTGLLPHGQVVRLLGRIDISSLEGIQMRAMLEMLYSSGIRPDELLGLDVGGVDITNQMARVLGKGRKERMVPFGQTARRYLENYLRGVRPLKLREPGEAALWLNRLGKRLRYHTFRRQLAELSRELNMPGQFTSYTFRRSCATELVRGGANLWHVKDLLGHENLETLKHYARLTVLDLKKTHARFHPRERDHR
jgi:integrase/recombinase XerD